MTKQAEPVWHFAERGFNDVEQEVTEGDQFNNETVESVEALVREATQNSQDAAVSATKPVRVRIAIIDESSGLDTAFLEGLTKGVRERMKAANLPEDANAFAKPQVLLIEDFETEGLTGQVDSESDEGNWRSFFFRHGGSFKKGGKNGRWGLGKLVFPMFSGARCFFGFTVRKGENKPLLLGQAVLRTHRLAGAKFAPHGHFGTSDNDRILPLSDDAWLAKFRKAFGLQRQTETGLSVVVPFPMEGADRDSLLGFVVQNYAYAILTHRLVVDVLGTTVDAQNLKEIGHQHLDAELVDFIERVHASKGDELTMVTPSAQQEIDEEQLAPVLEDLRKRYDGGQLVGFRVKVRLSSREDGMKFSHVDVFLMATTKPDAGGAIFVRGDITVPGEAALKFRTKGAYAALIAREDSVSAFLADAENPAHTHWSAQADRLRRNWRNPNSALRLIRNAPAALHKLLASGSEHENETALIDVFSVVDPESPHKGGAPKPKKKQDEESGSEDMPELPPPPKRRVVLTKHPGGFSFRAGPAFEKVALPAELRVRVAYDVEQGNAVKAWDRLDFALEDAKSPDVESSGGQTECAGNEIIFRIDEPTFELRASGFDIRRDLVVDFSLQ